MIEFDIAKKEELRHLTKIFYDMPIYKFTEKYYPHVIYSNCKINRMNYYYNHTKETLLKLLDIVEKSLYLDEEILKKLYTTSFFKSNPHEKKKKEFAKKKIIDDAIITLIKAEAYKHVINILRCDSFSSPLFEILNYFNSLMKEMTEIKEKKNLDDKHYYIYLYVKCTLLGKLFFPKLIVENEIQLISQHNNKKVSEENIEQFLKDNNPNIFDSIDSKDYKSYSYIYESLEELEEEKNIYLRDILSEKHPIKKVIIKKDMFLQNISMLQSISTNNSHFSNYDWSLLENLKISKKDFKNEIKPSTTKEHTRFKNLVNKINTNIELNLNRIIQLIDHDNIAYSNDEKKYTLEQFGILDIDNIEFDNKKLKKSFLYHFFTGLYNGLKVVLLTEVLMDRPHGRINPIIKKLEKCKDKSNVNKHNKIDDFIFLVNNNSRSEIFIIIFISISLYLSKEDAKELLKLLKLKSTNIFEEYYDILYEIIVPNYKYLVK